LNKAGRCWIIAGQLGGGGVLGSGKGNMIDSTLLKILQCADKTDGQVGRSDMLKILLGKESKKLSKCKFDHSLSHLKKEVILEHIDYLIERGCLVMNTFLFPMLVLTEAGQKRLNRMKADQMAMAMVMPERELGSTYVCDEKEFWELFPKDLEVAKERVIIVSPYTSPRRVATLTGDFQRLMARGVFMYIPDLQGILNFRHKRV